MEQKPAIVQAAKKDWQYYESKILASEECTGRLYREYKEGGAWKEHYKTWTDACEPLGKPRRTVDWIIKQDKDIRPESPNELDKVESDALKKVEAAREEKAEEPEPPAVHSADEKAPTPVKVELVTIIPNPKDNGKPKSQLAVWREIEEKLIGRAINRVDELNRQCPHHKCHTILLSHLKECLDILGTWRRLVK